MNYSQWVYIMIIKLLSISYYMNIYEESKIINLNSSNAIKNNGSFLSNVYFNFKNIIEDNDDVIDIKVSVTNAQIPFSFYNINVYNNILSINYNSTDYLLTLTRGNYNATNLITEIQNKLISNGLTNITITISSVTGCLLFTVSSGTLILKYNTSTIFTVLGLDNVDYTITSTLNAPFPLNLLGTLRLRICSYELITYNLDSSTGGTLNVLSTIPIEAPTFGIILYDNITNVQTKLNNNQLDGFDIIILDDNNNEVNFNNTNWTITILLTFIKKIRERKDTKKFEDYIKPILTLINKEIDNQQPEDQQPEDQQQQQPEDQQPEDQQPEDQQPDQHEIDLMEDNDLDLFLYNKGIDEKTGLLN